MRGMFRMMMMAGMAASAFAGYRAVSNRRARRNPSGLPEANIMPAHLREDGSAGEAEASVQGESAGEDKSG